MRLKQHIAKSFIIASFGSILGLSTTNAQQLIIPIGSQTKLEVLMPTMGMKMHSVLDEYGEPLQRWKSVGEPPIIRWQYELFSVYFESKFVMHSVVHFVPNIVEHTVEENLETK
jgi:hypothetical protein